MLSICGLCDRKFQSINSEDYCQVCRKAQRHRIWRCQGCEMYWGECLQSQCFSCHDLNGGRGPGGYYYTQHEWIKIKPGEPWISRYSGVYTDEDRAHESRKLKEQARTCNSYKFGF